MFGKRAPAQVVAISEGTLMYGTSPGVVKMKFNLVLDVHPPKGEAFRTKTRAKIETTRFNVPDVGSEVFVSIAPVFRRTSLKLSGDERYDNKLWRKQGQGQAKERKREQSAAFDELAAQPPDSPAEPGT